MQKTKKTKSDVLIKKRDNPRANEVLLDPEYKTTVSYGDRFIPRRYALANIDRNKKYTPKRNVKDVLMSYCKENYWREIDLTLALNQNFGVADLRVLQLTDPDLKSTDSALLESSHQRAKFSDWPCNPRKKPIAFPDTTHDLPGIDVVLDYNLVDWSVNGQIVASLGNDVVVWKRHEEITMVYSMKCPRSLAYSPNGNFLAIGCNDAGFPVLELWDVSGYGEFVVANGNVFAKKHLSVLCIEWSKCGKYLLCGTHFGTIFVLTIPELKVINKLQTKNKRPIQHLKFAPTMRYFASGDNGGDIVIYTWKACSVYLHARSRRKLNIVFDWHPWNGTDFAIAEEVPAAIVIIDLNKKEIVAHYQRRDTKICINSLNFNKITAELLVSISDYDARGCTNFKVLVLSSLDRVVDIIDIPETGARFMMWSPDGTKIATAGSDETLTLWDFYHANKNKLKNLSQSCKAEKRKQLIESKFGAQFKLWSFIK